MIYLIVEYEKFLNIKNDQNFIKSEVLVIGLQILGNNFYGK